jgi:hypothetical protein
VYVYRPLPCYAGASVIGAAAGGAFGAAFLFLAVATESIFFALFAGY